MQLLFFMCKYQQQEKKNFLLLSYAISTSGANRLGNSHHVRIIRIGGIKNFTLKLFKLAQPNLHRESCFRQTSTGPMRCGRQLSIGREGNVSANKYLLEQTPGIIYKLYVRSYIRM